MTTEDAEPDADEVRAHLVERPRATDQIYQAYPNTPVHSALDPVDGLPTPVMPHSIESALAPRLSRRTLVCLGEHSSYVVRDQWGIIKAVFQPEEVELTPGGQYRVPRELAAERLSEQIDARSQHYAVEPLVPQCKWYAAQLQDFPQDPDHKIVLRHCTARRVDYGDFLSLNDQAVYACELRDPPVGNRIELVRAHDAQQIAETAAKELADQAEQGDFDLEQALQQESDDDDAGGIFGR